MQSGLTGPLPVRIVASLRTLMYYLFNWKTRRLVFPGPFKFFNDALKQRPNLGYDIITVEQAAAFVAVQSTQLGTGSYEDLESDE